MRSFTLESFEEPQPGTLYQNQAYDDGFAAGHALGLQEANEEQAHLAAQTVQAIADLNFTYGEAKAEITQSLGPLFAEITQRLLPHCIAAGFGTEIATMLQTRLQDHLDGGLALCVHPSQVEAVKAAIGNAATVTDVVADETLSPHAAWLRAGATASHLDLDQLCAEITTILAAINLTSERMKPHG